jgi:beta-galactosidase/beta-glucuronidase
MRDIKMIRDAGMNFIRGSHYAHHPVSADECDRQGILFPEASAGIARIVVHGG